MTAATVSTIQEGQLLDELDTHRKNIRAFLDSIELVPGVRGGPFIAGAMKIEEGLHGIEFAISTAQHNARQAKGAIRG